MGEEGVDVVEEVSVSVGHAAGGEDEDALAGGFWGIRVGGAIRGGGIGRGGGVGVGFGDGG